MMSGESDRARRPASERWCVDRRGNAGRVFAETTWSRPLAHGGDQDDGGGEKDLSAEEAHRRRSLGVFLQPSRSQQKLSLIRCCLGI